MFLQGNFYHKNKKYQLSLNDDGISWQSQSARSLRRSFLSSEIISCWLCPRGSLSCAPGVQGRRDCPHWKKGPQGLSVEVCCRRSGHRWATAVFVFFHGANEVVATWLEAIWTLMHNLCDRPRRLLVLINPVGGRGKGVDNFEKKVAPLFHRACVHTQVAQTKYKGHGTLLVQESFDEGILQKCDGVVAVGGDGLVSEVVKGLFIIACGKNGINLQNPTFELPSTQIRLGIIPSGSTDATCYATHGSSDIITAAIHIIMGDERAVDVAGIYFEGALQRVATSLISYGFFGDLLRASEKWRCLGPPRYLLSGAQQLLRNRSYLVSLRVKKDEGAVNVGDIASSMSSTVSCSSICSICCRAEDPATSDDQWEEMGGKYSVVSAAISSCACDLTPQGVSPSAHLGDGRADLILVKGDSRAKLVSYLYHTSVTANSTNLSHVKMIRTSELQFTAESDAQSLFNCDGEEFEASSLTIKMHRQKLKLFCRGLENPPSSSTSRCKTSSRF